MLWLMAFVSIFFAVLALGLAATLAASWLLTAEQLALVEAHARLYWASLEGEAQGLLSRARPYWDRLSSKAVQLVEGPLHQLIVQLVEYATNHGRKFLSVLPQDVRQHVTGTLSLSVPMALIGAIGGLGYALWQRLSYRVDQFVKKNLQVSLVFTNSDKFYDSLLEFIGTRCHVATGTILASTMPRGKPSWKDRLQEWYGGKESAPKIYYTPDIQPFSNFFMWRDARGRKHKIWISRHVEKPQFKMDKGKGGRDPETLRLTVWWTTDESILKGFMTSALETMVKDDSMGKVDIFVKHTWLAMWTKAMSKEKRDKDTVVLDEDLADFVLEDMRHFFTPQAAEWYHNAGIPYRRGYLLFGPPGCGKTSFAQVLAGELGLDVCLMNLSNQEMNDDDLAELLRAAPAKSMLLLEDVDAIFVERAAGKEKRGGVSFSGLLNALDGAAAQEGCVILMTTNHKDRLDEALIRPGRCDVHVKIDRASQDQAARMYNRFFANEAKIKSIDSIGTVTTTGAHGFTTGTGVRYKKLNGSPLMNGKVEVEDRSILYVNVLSGPSTRTKQLTLYSSAATALAGGREGLLQFTGGDEVKLQAQLDASVRFGTRIPEKQVSMAKLQGYLMKQKLCAEQEVKRKRESGHLPHAFQGLDPQSDDFKFALNQEVLSLARESAVVNVHELLDVKQEADEVDIPVYDHLRRVGLHKFAPFFEHFGYRGRKDLSRDVVDTMSQWDPDLKIKSTQRNRLVALIEGKQELDSFYRLADLSILIDRFVAAFNSKGSSPAPASRDDNAGSSSPVKSALPLFRASSVPVRSEEGDEAASRRLELLRLGSRLEPTGGLKLVQLAHDFQERLEVNGRTEVSIWQLEMHFKRYAGDPVAAVENCSSLRRSSASRSPDERTACWMSTFGFLRRLGLEEYAFTLEDQGFMHWHQWKHMSKDDLKDKAEMSDAHATLCHAVLQASSERPDLLRKFEVPEFEDLQAFFCARFPMASEDQARKFALELTDELGAADVSCFQVEKYLESSPGAREALSNLAQGLPSEAIAQASRVKPEPPPPPSPPTTWVYTWLKDAELQHLYKIFEGEVITTREMMLQANFTDEVLQKMGLKLGERIQILDLLKKEVAKW